MLNNPESTEELIEKMDAALAALPLDFEAYGTDYQQKAGILSELHQYAEGIYTIFPIPEVETSFQKQGYLGIRCLCLIIWIQGHCLNRPR